MKTIILAPDIGNSTTKTQAIAVYDGVPVNTVQFQLDTLGKLMPSDDLPGQHPSVLLFPEGSRGIYGGRAREVGARILQEASIYDSPLYDQMVFAATAESLERLKVTDDMVDVLLVIGFPATHTPFGADVKTRLLSQAWTVQKEGGRSYRVTFTDVLTESQPLYGIIDQVFTWKDGRLETSRGAELFANGTVLGISWGAYSTDFILSSSSLKAARTTTSLRGTFALLDQLKAMIFKTMRRTLPEYELMFRVFPDKRIVWEDQEYDFSAEIPGIVETAIPDIVNDVRLFLKKTEEQIAPYSCLLMGGGCMHAEPFLRAAFKSKFPGGIALVKDDAGKPEPLWSIARGMAKMGMIQVAKKGA